MDDDRSDDTGNAADRIAAARGTADVAAMDARPGGIAAAAADGGAGELAGMQAPPLTDGARAFVAMLFDAARSGDAAMLGEFLDQGLPANLANDSGDTLLMIASYNGHPDATRLLLDRGADPERQNARGQTPLAGVAFKGDVMVAGLLLDHGAAVDGPIAGGKTPLMMAAMFDRLEMVDLLLAHGADAGVRSDEGMIAADTAKAMSATRVLERLNQIAGPAGSDPFQNGAE